MTAPLLDPARVLPDGGQLAQIKRSLGWLPAPIQHAALIQLANPTTPMPAVAAALDCDILAVSAAAAALQTTPTVGALTCSPWYPFRLRWQTAAATADAATADPGWWRSLTTGAGVAAKTVELHASHGTCGYHCRMCLWSDQENLTYQTRQLATGPPLTTQQWASVLDTLAQRGTRTVVISGGGEPLLNPGLPDILAHARAVGLQVHLYTTGFNLHPHRAALWRRALELERIRFSIHAATPALYDEIAGLPKGRGGLARVTRNLRLLLQARGDRPHPRIGIGFVSQPLNHRQILDIAGLAAEVGVDFLDIRKDEVDVTEPLTGADQDAFHAQLQKVRAAAAEGCYGRLHVDLPDELVALADGKREVLQALARRTPECLAKFFRPTISPYGILSPCDLTAEPRFANHALELGRLDRQPLPLLLDALPDRHIPDACAQCMPSSRTGNAVYHKLVADQRAGIPPAAQPFATPASHGPAPAAARGSTLMQAAAPATRSG